jgi:hypothetical protein
VLLEDGRIVVALKRAWADGTSHVVLEPLELLEKLAALTPRPRINLVLYHGVLAPHASWRRRVVPAVEEPLRLPGGQAGGPERAGRRRSWAWADLMRRAFELDVLACPRCGGRMRVLATIEDPHLADVLP